jgi:tricorn protease
MVADSSTGYLRFPTISGGTIVFVSEDDLWTVPAEGGVARRLTADLLGVAGPVLSPDGRMVAFVSDADGPTEVHVVPSAGGMARRLTWLGAAAGSRPAGLGSATKVLGWAPDGRVVFASPSGQPFSSLTMAYAIGTDGAQPPEPLPYGPVRDISYGKAGGVVIGRNTADPAFWKRYRGGTAGWIWLDRSGDGTFQILLRPEAIGGNLASPMWVGDRIYFLSDHEGIGNLYSCTLDGADIARHSDHDEYYARLASSDGTKIVYQVAGRLWCYDPATGQAGEVPVELGSPRTQRRPRFVAADQFLGGYQLDKTGKRIVLDSRGKLFSLALFDRPVIQHGASQGVRYRLARFLGDSNDIVAVSDATGKEVIEVHQGARSDDGEGGAAVRPLEVPDLGRVVELVPSPDGSRLAVTNHQNQLILIEVGPGSSQVVDESAFGHPRELTWSADSKWIAYSYPATGRTRQIKLAEVAGPGPVAVTSPQFVDGCPSFDPTGTYLYFLSWRTFDPVYDSIFFDLGFPLGARPYLVTLRASTPSPFVVRPEPDPEPADGAGASPPGGADGEAKAEGAGLGGGVPVVIDLDGIGERVVEVPVPEARYEQVVALKRKLLLLSRPLQGALGRSWASLSPSANGVLESYDLVEDRRETFLTEVAEVVVSGDRSHIAYGTGGGAEAEGRRLRVVATAQKPDEERAKEPPGRRSGFVDLSRVRVLVEPGPEWSQMLREAWRLQQDQFWTPDLSGVDWQQVLERYLPLVEQVATRTEMADLIWELQGELGTSHAYELFGEYRQAPHWGQAFLAADLARDESGRWVVAKLVPGASWHAKEVSPLLTPGAGITVGTAVLAVNGQAVDPGLGVGPLLANQAGLPVELTVAGPTEAGSPAQARTVVVPTLGDEGPLRYRNWVDSNRERVRQATGGRVGYVHIPDMGPTGWSEFHRSYMAEVERHALIIDVRFNGGGHVSALVLEKLRRRRIGWDVPRWGSPVPYPEEAPVGPLVALTNEWAGSDGDIFTHGFKLFGLGPVVGTRTWGGVIGINPTHGLVDGSVTTQPEFAFWFDDVGWAVENYGSEPTEEVLVRPQDYASGEDPQLARAIELVLGALDSYQTVQPDNDQRPRKALPVLPPRPSGPGVSA